jgi:hypothetical protein
MLSPDKPNPKEPPLSSGETDHQTILPTAPIPESISQNIETEPLA